MKPWPEWNSEDWNNALFDHYFMVRDGADIPGPRIAMSEDDFRTLVGDRRESGDKLRGAYLEAIHCRSARELAERLSAAHYPTWELAPQFGRRRPSYFAYLALSCLVAA